MNKIKILFVLLAIVISTTSCMTTRTSVGSFNVQQGQIYQYAKGKQCYLFWGLIPLGHTSVNTPGDGDCQVRTKFGFVDWLVSGITGGIFSMQSIRVYAKRPIAANDAFNVGDSVTYKKGTKYAKGSIESIIDGEHCTVRTEDGKIQKFEFEKLSK